MERNIPPKKRTLLVVLDGLGISENRHKNAVRDAKTPHLDYLFSHYPMALLEAGGPQVGLPKGIVGNSEVGHMTLGAGRPLSQDLVRINESIRQGTFKTLPLIQELKARALKSSKRIHLIGLLSSAGVHAHLGHLQATLDVLCKNPVLKIYLHAFMDGRDTSLDSGKTYLQELQKEQSHRKNFHVASIQGRFFGMDRDRHWERIKACYDTFTGRGTLSSLSPLSYLTSEYQNGRFDEFITPALFDREYAMSGQDVVFLLNFRPDRAIQITSALNLSDFDQFERPWRPSYFLCMVPTIQDEMPSLPILFNKEAIPDGLSEYLSQKGHAQFKIAETEKYAHVTFFFNGGKKRPFPLEEQVLIPSPREIKAFDQRPEMSAFEVTECLLKALEDPKYTFYLVNYANSDMVGHTGNYSATIKAIEILDSCVKKLQQKAEEQNITLILTSDHGNSDQMAYPDGRPHTSHTTAPVPFCIFHPALKNHSCPLFSRKPNLQDVAPTVLATLGVSSPKTFEGVSLLPIIPLTKKGV